jgi:methylthioribose-1-phosphate isomerase
MFSRYAELVRYNQSDHTILVVNLGVAQDETAYAAYTRIEDIALAAQNVAAVSTYAAAFVVGYGLALVAHQWADRPTDARRGATIQASERFLWPGASRFIRSFVTQALAQADAAALDNVSAEQALLEFVDEQIRTADRAAERCGRHAAGLVDDGDQLLCVNYAGPALPVLLHAARTEGMRVQVITIDDAQARGVQLLTYLAAALEVPERVVRTSELAAAIGNATSVCFIGAERVALDGSTLASAGVADQVLLAHAQGVPCYVLAPSGPDAAAATAEDFALSGDFGALIPHELISAIVTDRGMYRTAMIARYLNDRDAPPDIIPLLN